MADNITQPIVRYDGDYITCYPGSNQKDDGKLNLEYNMARIVTRLSSKNFCIVKPSFALSLYTNQDTNLPQIQVDVGECSINGMDLIMTQILYIDPPVGTGKFHLAFKLARDSSYNVMGDLIYGVSTTFEGVYLSWYDTKPDPVDPDMLYLGSVEWDGNKFTNLQEDEDKYGRLWAEDVLGKFMDPKHPDIRRQNLQELIYKLPDWYFSKEGDTVYGPIIMSDNRQNNNAGIIMNVDTEGSHITIKDPEVDNDKLQLYGDLNRDGVIDESDVQIIKDIISGKIQPTRLQKQLGDVNHDGTIDEKDLQYIMNFVNKQGNYGDTGNIYYIDDTQRGINFDIQNNNSSIEIGKASIYENEIDDKLHIHNVGDICVDAEGEVSVQADGKISMSTESETSPILSVDDDKVSITDPNADGLSIDFSYPSNTIAQYKFGKAIWQYNNDTQKVSLLQTDVKYLDIVPNSDFNQNVRVKDTIYIGNQSIYGREQTFLKATRWRLAESVGTPSNYIEMTPNTISMINPNGDNTSYISISNKDNSKYTKIYDSGTIELQNPTDSVPSIIFKDGTAAYNVTISKIKGEKKLNIDSNVNITNNLVVQGTSSGNGLITTNGVITFKNGSNDASITKPSNSNILYTSGNLKVGPSGSNDLSAGNTVINGTFAVGGTTYQNSEFKVDSLGNLETTGTIRGAKVYNAVYNGWGEIFQKDKDEIIEYGDLVCIREDGLVHKIETDDDILNFIGICSDTIGFQLGGQGIPKEEQCEVELDGKIWAKTDNMSIKPGDHLKPVNDGKVDVTEKSDKPFAIALTRNVNGKVKLFIR